METIRSTTLERLETFVKNGGRVIMLGNAPTLVDAQQNNRVNTLNCERVPFERLHLINALADLCDIEIRSSDGTATDNLFYQLREEPGCRWLFVAQADKPENRDIPQGDVKKIKILGEYSVTLYDTIKGEIRPLKVEITEGWTCLNHKLYEHDSLLLKLEEGKDCPCDISAAESNKQTENVKFFLGSVPVTLHEPNVLLLDMAQYALDDNKYRHCEEILRLDSILREELKWPPRGNAIAQPWVEHDTSTPHNLRLKYTFKSEISIKNTELALENAAITNVTLNGIKAGPVNGWYVDKCIGKVALPEIQPGENIIELTIPYGKKTDIEACYLLGDFGVKVHGIDCKLTKPVTELAFGDITRQGLPFYGGNLTYHLDADTEGDSLEIVISYYRGHLLRVAVDDNDAGIIALSPYKLNKENLKPGKHKIDITYYGSRVNTFGQLHRIDRHHPWWGPDSWRTKDEAWSYEYRFWPQGILKSPEIR